MGYSTTYRLTWAATPEWKAPRRCDHRQRKGAKFCDECGAAVGTLALNELVADQIALHQDRFGVRPDGETEGNCKWYEHEADMCALSEAVPNVLFHLTGEGEEAGDIWDLFALDGRIQKHKAKIVRVETPDPEAWK